MSKVKYIKCDICGKRLNVLHNRWFRFQRSIDICDECVDKLKYLETDIEAEQRTLSQIECNTIAYTDDEKYRDAYRKGMDDALKILSHYRLNKIKR